MGYYVRTGGQLTRRDQSFKLFKKFLLVFLLLNIAGSVAVGAIAYSVFDDLVEQGQVIGLFPRIQLIVSVAFGTLLSAFGLFAVYKEQCLSINLFAIGLAILVIVNLFNQRVGVTIVNIVVWAALAAFSAAFGYMVKRVNKSAKDVYDYEIIA